MTEHENPVIIEPSNFDWKKIKEIYDDKCFADNNFNCYRIRNCLNKIPAGVIELLLNLNKRIEELEFKIKQLEGENK